MAKVQTGSIKQELGDYLIDGLVADGPFSWVYKVKHKAKTQWKALKLSKPAEQVQNPNYTAPFATQCLTVVLGGTSFVTPDPVQLLLLQQDKLKCQSKYLVQLADLQISTSGCYVVMEWLDGKTLREAMQAEPVSISILIELAQAMEDLSKHKDFAFHGDLKPENILLTNSGVKILDPGYFGPLDCLEGSIEKCIVTSPSYYPFLIPDDLFALGIICWEAANHAHPLDGVTDSSLVDLNGVGKELLGLVREHELVGQHFLTPILQTTRPRQIRPDMPTEVEKFLLKSLRLSFDQHGTLNVCQGFASFKEMIEDLNKLLQQNVKHL